MQSYTSYRVSEFLKDRLPYIPPKDARPLMDPEQVAVAYNERAVPKLADLLTYKELSSEKQYLEYASNLLKDTGIKTRIIKQYLPVMNKLINKYLTSMDFFVNFNINENFNFFTFTKWWLG